MKLDQSVISVPRDRAARIAGLTSRQVTYWSRTGIAVPTVERRVTGRSVARLYDFTDLMSLLIAAELRGRKISLQQIRRVVNHLRDRGYDRPLTELRFATLKGHIYIQHEDGTWEDDVRPDQVVIHEVLDLEPLRARIAKGVQRGAGQAGKIERRAGALGSKQLFAGTRVPVDTVIRYLAAGRTVAEIVESFPVLTARDVESASHLASTSVA